MMLYPGREQDPRAQARGMDEDRRTFTRRIDCADAGQRPAVNPNAAERELRDPRQGQGRRRLDID